MSPEPVALKPVRLLGTLLLIIAQLAALLPAPALARPASPAPVAATATLAEQPLDLQYALSEQLGLNDVSFSIEPDASGLVADNASQGLRTTFDALGMQLRSGQYGWGVELAGFGRGAALAPVAMGAQSRPAANRVEFNHGPFSSWYVNGPLGVQQGWTVRERPEGAGQPLALTMRQSGSLQGRLTADRRGLALVDASGATRMTYDGLIAHDAAGRDLPVSFELADACGLDELTCANARLQPGAPLQLVRILVDDSGATYPLTIDPWVKTDTLRLTNGPSLTDNQVVLSADGATIAVAVPYVSTGIGAIYVFQRDAFGRIDAQNVARLTSNTPYINDPKFGRAVAMSADGTTIVASRRVATLSPGLNGVDVFVRPGPTWSSMTATKRLDVTGVYIGAGGKFDSAFYVGNNDGGLAISADGSTFVVGSSDLVYCEREQSIGGDVCKPGDSGVGLAYCWDTFDNFNCTTSVRLGGAFLYQRPAGGWANSGPAVTAIAAQRWPSPAIYSNDQFDYIPGDLVAISAAGDRVFLHGMMAIEGWNGFFYARRPAGGWPAYINPIATPNAIGQLRTPYRSSTGNNYVSLALSADGKTLVAGRPSADIATVWTNIPDQSGTTLQLQPTFDLTGGAAANSMGRSVAMTADGSKIAVSTIAASNGAPQVWTFARPAAGWPNGGGPYSNTAPFFADQIPGSTRVAISGDGETLVVGADVLLPQLTTLTLSPEKAIADGARFTLTLQGSNFSENTRVFWGDYQLTQTRLTATEIDVLVPGELVAAPASVTLLVQNPLPGGGVATLTYQVENPPPVLAALDHATSYAGEPGLTLTVTGSSFLSSSKINWNGAPLSTTYVNERTLRAELSAAQVSDVGEATVSVTTPGPGGGTSAPLTHTLTPAPAPELSGISPFSRAAGKTAFTLTAVGSNFLRRSQIVFAGTPLTTTYVNSATLTAEVPTTLIEVEGPLSVAVTTAAPGGGTSAPQLFTVTSATPRLDDVFPFFGPPAGGAEVTLSGMNLESTSAVSFGEQSASIVSASESILVVTTPPGPVGSVDVTVTTRYGSATISGGYVYATSEPAQPWRDLGAVRLWADDFSTSDGLTVATGRISLGHAGRNARYFRVSDQVSWTISDTLAISGTLGFFGGQGLVTGRFSLDTGSGAITAQPGALILPNTLGSTAIAISPALSINALEAQVPVTAALVLSLPENPAVGLNVAYLMNRDGTLSPAGTSALTLRLAGGDLAADVSVGTDGLSAPNARLSLPGLAAPVVMPAPRIDDAGLRFGQNGSFALPNINLGGGVLTLSHLTATLESGPEGYALPLSGDLSLGNLPEGISHEAPLSNLRLAGGIFTGSVGTLALTMGGAPLTFSGAALSFVGERYSLAAPSAIWALPAAWGSGTRPTMTLSNLALTTEAPFLRIDGGNRFTLPGAYSIGGTTAARNSAELSRVRAELALDGQRWVVNLTADLRMRLGSQPGDGGSYNDAPLAVRDDSVGGELFNTKLTLAGLPLVANLSYRDGAFSAAQATLSMPSRWNRTQAQTGGLAITNNTLRLGPETFGPGGGAPIFSIPDIPLSVLVFADNTAKLTDQAGAYVLNIATTLRVNKVKTAAGQLPSKDVALTVRGGRVTGTVSSLEFMLTGFAISANNLQVIDDRVRSDTFSMTLPPRLGGVTTTFYGLELGGPKGIAVRGGAFKLPDFQLGTVGVKQVAGSFLEENGTYVVAAEGMLEFTKFSVEAAFKFAYSSNTNSVEVRRLFIAFEGKIPTPAVAISNTGLFFTRISGEFSLEDGTMTITLGTRISTLAEVAGQSLLHADATVTLQIRPSLEFRATTDVYMIGMRVATANLRIWGNGFAFQGRAEQGIIRMSMEVTFGRDAWNEFTFYGAVNAEVVIRKGMVFSVPKLGIYIPPSDITLANAALEAGKFSRGDERIWGARGTLSVVRIFSVSAMARISGGVSVSLDSSIWEYQPVRPIGYSSRGPTSAGWPAAVRSEATPSRDRFIFTPANPGYELALVEALSPEQRDNPLPLQISSPRGVAFTATMVYTAPDRSYRIYSVKLSKAEDLLGTWTVSPAMGNAIFPLGLIPPPEVRTARACLVGGACLKPGSETTLQPGQPLAINWDTRSFTPGLTVELFATGADGRRSYISGEETAKQALIGQTRWTPALASGSYTLTLQLTGANGAPVRRDLGRIVYNDSSAPAAPRGLVARPQRDLSVLLEWEGAAAEEDVLGYQVRVGDGPAIRTDGRLSSLRSYGLTPGGTYQLAVAAYDHSGNLGPEAVVQATLPLLGLSGNWPPAGAVITSPKEVGASFSGFVTGATLRVTNAQGQVVAGSSVALTGERLGDAMMGQSVLAADPATGITEAEYGAVFTPAADKLAPGVYTATISAWDPAAGEQVTVSWNFTVYSRPLLIYLPIVIR